MQPMTCYTVADRILLIDRTVQLCLLLLSFHVGIYDYQK